MTKDEATWRCSHGWLRGEQCEICKETMDKDKALKLALEALEKKAGSWGVGQEDLNKAAITAIKEALAQPEQEPNKDGSLCPEFWDWLTKAYNFDGNGAFTKYNMEVAFLAGKQTSQPEQKPVAWMTINEQGVSDMIAIERKKLDGALTALCLIRMQLKAWEGGDKSIADIKDALALTEQPAQQEPVAYLHQCGKKPELKELSFKKNEPSLAAKGYRSMPLAYTTPQPPQRTWGKPWVSLTAEDRWKILYATEHDERITVMQLVEAKLKSKNA